MFTYVRVRYRPLRHTAKHGIGLAVVRQYGRQVTLHKQQPTHAVVLGVVALAWHSCTCMQGALGRTNVLLFLQMYYVGWATAIADLDEGSMPLGAYLEYQVRTVALEDTCPSSPALLAVQLAVWRKTVCASSTINIFSCQLPLP